MILVKRIYPCIHLLKSKSNLIGSNGIYLFHYLTKRKWASECICLELKVSHGTSLNHGASNHQKDANDEPNNVSLILSGDLS